ncbi:MAG TPA: hypothetical protein VF456_20515 [Vicinamibacterales bacterium]
MAATARVYPPFFNPDGPMLIDLSDFEGLADHALKLAPLLGRNLEF